MATTNLQIKQGLLSTYTTSSQPADYVVSTPSAPFSLGYADAVYFPVDPSAVNLRQKKIKGVNLKVYCRGIQYSYQTDTYTDARYLRLQFNALSEQYDPDVLRQEGRLKWDIDAQTYLYLSELGWSWYDLRLPFDSDTGELFSRGIRLAMNVSYEGASVRTFIESYPPGSAYAPRIEVEYEELVPVVLSASPQSGWVSPERDVTLSWLYSIPSSPDPVRHLGSFLEWQVGDNSVQRVTLGAVSSYTIPASSLPQSGTFRWRVAVSASNGQISEYTPWYSLTTTEAAPSVSPVFPVAGFVTASERTEFSWRYEVATGTVPSAYELQYRYGAYEWQPLASAVSSDTKTEVDTSSLPAGQMEWRVRASNQSGVWSEWSDSAQIVLVSAPSTPVLSVTSGRSPQPVLTWQSVGQAGYQLRIGDYDTGTVYGTAQQYRYSGYLPDGLTLIQLRTQNQYELWSAWSEYVVDVKNNPSAVDDFSVFVELRSFADAFVLWPTVEGAQSYLVYRDNVLVGRCGAEDTSYSDALGVGEVSYRVRAVLDGGNYVLSEPFVVTLQPKGVQIRALQGGEWLDVSHSLTSLPSVDVTRTRAVSLYNYAGARYPVPEVSPFETMTYNLSVAFKRGDPMVARFEALMGQLVIVKDQYSNLVVGVLGTWTRAQNAFVVSYKATITQVDRSLYEVDSI